MADGLLDTYLADGEGEYIKGFAGPFTMLVIADLLGVPEEDRGEFAENLHQAPGSGGGVGGTKGESLAHSPLEYLYQRFSELRRGPPARPARRRAHRPGHRHVPRRVDARGHRRGAGRRQPVRRRAGDHGAAAQHRAASCSPSDPELQQQLRERPRAGPQLRRGVPAVREPGQGRLPAVARRRPRWAASTCRPGPR